MPPAENLPRIEQALRQGGNTDYQVKRPARLNHLLQTSETGLPLEYARIEETIAPTVLEAISDWIRERSSEQSERRP